MSPLSIKGGWIRPALTQGYLSNVGRDKRALTKESKSLHIIILHNASNLYQLFILPTTTYLARIAVCSTRCGIRLPDDHEQKLGHTYCSNHRGFSLKSLSIAIKLQLRLVSRAVKINSDRISTKLFSFEVLIKESWKSVKVSTRDGRYDHNLILW